MSVKLPLPVEHYDINRLERFVFAIYNHTNGQYPLLEWVPKKPPINDFASFHKVYYSFLKTRLEIEFDKIYIWDKGNIIATVALVFGIENNNIPWAKDLLKMQNAALIEFLMVSPSLQKRGIGRYVLEFALQVCKKENKKAYIVTSPDLDAYGFYVAMGLKVVKENPPFRVLSYREK